jgi:FAD binding domain-containing protein
MRHASRPRVLVSGASIAGPAVAHWLNRYGYAVTVVERAPGLRPGGQAVDLRGAGRTVIQRMGLLDQARQLALHQQGIAWVNANGKVTARFRADEFGGEGIISEIEGLHSVVRELAFGPEQEYVQPLGCYTAWFTAPAAPELDGWYQMHNAPGGRVGSVRPGRGPRSGCRRPRCDR